MSLPATDEVWADITRQAGVRGFAIVRGAVPPATIEQLAADLAADIEATPFSSGPFYGSSTKRFGRLLTRSAIARDLALHPTMFGAASAILRRTYPHIGLNLTQLIAVHPGAPSQVPHRDDAMWPVGAPIGEHLVNVLWPLCPFRADNGATQIWGLSHRGYDGAAAPELEIAEMMPGDALIVLGSTLHAQGANESNEVRTCMVVGYRAAWLLPSENPWLSYPPEVVRTWPDELRDLIGYRRLPPNLNGVDCRCPSEAFGTAGSGAVDELWPHQRDGIARFHALAG